MKYGFLTGILYLAPYKLSGKNVCPAASLGCRLSCLNTAGRGQMGVVQKARLRKTKMFFQDRNKFLSQLKTEIGILSRRAANKNMKLAIRLNGTSDLPFERYLIDGKNLMDHFPKVKFYDYTKLENRINDQLPGNYHLTFSRSETNEAVIDQVIEKAPVSVVFKHKLPRLYNGYKVINGDLHDMRFKNQSGVIIGLIAKGKARKDTTGFAI
jgi:hypothetical protein